MSSTVNKSTNDMVATRVPMWRFPLLLRGIVRFDRSRLHDQYDFIPEKEAYHGHYYSLIKGTNDIIHFE